MPTKKRKAPGKRPASQAGAASGRASKRSEPGAKSGTATPNEGPARKVLLLKAATAAAEDSKRGSGLRPRVGPTSTRGRGGQAGRPENKLLVPGSMQGPPSGIVYLGNRHY